jgi:DNA-binding transcriptional regulator PaaX
MYMGHYETRQVLDRILGIIGAEGMSGITLSATQASMAIAEIIATAKLDINTPISRIVSEFRRQELVTFTREESNVLRLQLTVKGIHRLQRAQLEAITVPTPQTWDGRWRMVLFDIPARRAESRYILTSQLKRLGFVMVQRSMWLHPYPCFDEVAALLQYANLQPFVSLAELSRLDTYSSKKILAHYPELSQ